MAIIIFDSLPPVGYYRKCVRSQHRLPAFMHMVRLTPLEGSPPPLYVRQHDDNMHTSLIRFPLSYQSGSAPERFDLQTHTVHFPEGPAPREDRPPDLAGGIDSGGGENGCDGPQCFHLTCTIWILQADSILMDFEAITDPSVLANERARKMYRHMTKGGADDEVPEDELEKEGARSIDGEDCPICYEQMVSAGGEATTFCALCRNSMHQVMRGGEGWKLLRIALSVLFSRPFYIN